MRAGIYRILNTVNGKSYIGSSETVRHRLVAHRSMLRLGKHTSRALQRAWVKHGPDRFTFEVIEPVADVSTLLVREQHWIDHYDAANPRRGYNACPVAGTRKGTRQPPSVAEKMRAFHLGKPKSPEHRAAISAARKGYKMPDSTKAKLRAAATAQMKDPEARRRLQDHARRQSRRDGKFSS